MEYKYKAFISYRHLEPDMQAAEKLQKLLEAYKPPKNLGKTKENWRIFRDVSELQSSSDLSEDIRNAIDNSEFLIVICSPKYNESKWCKQELTRFRELHNNTNDNIITLLVNGQPQEAFPEELTYTEVNTTDENGKEVKVRMEVEPLAANITADSLKESMKRLNTEYLRIAAPLLGCDFNDLFQREKRREAARRRRIFGGVSGVLSLITVISVASAVTISGKNVRIQQQNDQIMEQNSQIKEQNSQIMEQNEQIERKNTDLMVENSGHLAVESENLFSESRLVPAIMKAVEALPAQEGEKPVIPEAEYALSREMGMFIPNKLAPRISLRHERSVEKLSFMAGGKSVVSQDATGLYFWNAETGELIKKVAFSDSAFASENHRYSNKLTAIFDIDPDKTGTYFSPTSSPGLISYSVSSVFNQIYTDFVHDADEEEPGTGGDVYLYNSDGAIWRLDALTGDAAWSAPAPESASESISIMLRKDHILRLWRSGRKLPGGTDIPGDGYFLDIIDCETGAVTETIDVTGLSDSSLGYSVDVEIFDVRDGLLYIYLDNKMEVQSFEIKDHAAVKKNALPEPGIAEGVLHSVYMEFMGSDPVVISGDIIGFDLTTTISRCDSGLKEKKWSTSIPVNYQNNGRVFCMPAAETGYEHDVLALTTNRTFSFVDYETGAVISSVNLDAEIIDVSFTRSGLVMFTDTTGSEYVVSLGHYTGGVSERAAYNVQNIETSVSLCSYSRGKYVTAGDYSNTAYIQYPEDNAHFTAIDTGEYMYSPEVLAVTDDGAFAAVRASYFPDGEYNSDTEVVPHLFIYGTADGKLTEISGLEGYSIHTAAFIGNTLYADAAKILPGGGYDPEDVMFSVDITDGTVTPVSAPTVKNSVSQMIPTGEGIMYLCDYNKNVACIDSTGKCTTWAASEEGASADKKVIDDRMAVCGDRAAIHADDLANGGECIMIHSFGTGSETKLDWESGAGREVRHIFWQNENTVGVLFSSGSVALFDAQSGSLITETELSGLVEEAVSVAPMTADTFGVLCRDSCIYEADAKGLTGRSCRLDFGAGEENTIRGYDSTRAGLLSVSPSADSSRIYVVWDRNKAWLLDTDRFAVRFRIDDFDAAPSGRDIVFISDDMHTRAGFFPVYTTEQLLEAAKDYLFALGEM